MSKSVKKDAKIQGFSQRNGANTVSVFPLVILEDLC